MTGMIVTMADQEGLIRWAEPRMGVGAGLMPPETEALGVIEEDTGEIHAVIALNAFYAHYASMHVATNGRRRWVTRPVLRAAFGYAFEFKGLRRLNFHVSCKNIEIQVFALKLGLRIEGTTRCGFDDGSDGVLFGMIREECPWINGESSDG